MVQRDCNMRKSALMALAALMAASGATLAGATQAESQERRVHYSDLDLSRPEGIRILHRRIAIALEAVCGSYAGTQSSGAAPEADAITQCRRAAKTQADEKLALLMAKDVRMSSAAH